MYIDLQDRVDELDKELQWLCDTLVPYMEDHTKKLLLISERLKDLEAHFAARLRSANS